MENKYNLSRLKSCDQVWEDMQPCEGGRFCSSCKNVIYDMRGLSDLEIAYMHIQNGGKLCGIYDPERLHHPKTPRIRPAHRKIWAAGLFGWLSAASLKVQAMPTAPSTLMIDYQAYRSSETFDLKENKTNEKTVSDSIKIINGTIKDHTGEVVIGGSVFIENTNKGVISDIDGRYSLDVTEEFEKADSITLIFQYVGYNMEKRSVQRSAFTAGYEAELNVEFPESHIQITEFNVTSRKPGLWYKLKKLFRKKR